MVAEGPFTSLAKPEYEKNMGRIKDVDNLNAAITAITRGHTSQELIDFFTSITVPVSRINSIREILDEPLVRRRLLSTRDSRTDTAITLAPPPNMTSFLEESDRQMSFPPRFGGHNSDYLGRLGYSEEDIAGFKERGII